jgi:hypothetical protein
LLDADADRADLELRLNKLLLKDRAPVHPFAGIGGSWRKAVVHTGSRGREKLSSFQPTRRL